MATDVPLTEGGPDRRDPLLPGSRKTVRSYDGRELGFVSQATASRLHDALDAIEGGGYWALRATPTGELREVFATAADRLADQREEWAREVTLATGRPYPSSLAAVGEVIDAIDGVYTLLERQGYPPEAIDGGDAGKYHYPRGHHVGVVSPGNHPTVEIHATVMPQALKVPTVVKPSNREPFTEKRITDAMYAAADGSRDLCLPDRSRYLLPGSREFADTLLNTADLGVVFGGPTVAAKHAGDRNKAVHGPGNSKMVVFPGYEADDRAVELAATGMLGDAGMGCINESQFVTFQDGEAFAERLAARALEAETRAPMAYSPSDEFQVPALEYRGGHTPEERAERLDAKLAEFAEMDGVRDVTADFADGDRILERDGAYLVRPTVVYVDFEAFDGGDHPAFRELAVPYAAVTELPYDCDVDALADRPAFERLLSGSLSVSIVGEGPEVGEMRTYLRDRPGTDGPNKVHVNESACDIDLGLPHEGTVPGFLLEAGTDGGEHPLS